MPCVTSGIQSYDLIAAHLEVLGGRDCIPDPVAKLPLYSADGEVCIFVTFAQSITFDSIIL